MNLLEPQPTPYDLRWRMLGISVRVHPGFWIFSAIFGWSWGQAFGFTYLLVWIACTFLSILFHELGHVVMGILCGQPGHIVLYSFGGLAIGQYQLARRWQRIAISLAGPGAGFLLFGLVWVFKYHLLPQIDPAGNNLPLWRGVAMLLFMNLFWNALNLVPVIPLDGGQVMREVVLGLFPGHGLRLAAGISFLTAGTIAVYSLLAARNPQMWFPPLDPMFNTILFGLLAFQSFAMFQDAQRQRRRWDEPDW